MPPKTVFRKVNLEQIATLGRSEEGLMSSSKKNCNLINRSKQRHHEDMMQRKKLQGNKILNRN